MLKVKIDFGHHGAASFKCPKCSVHDAVYMQMPELCWSCGARYPFSLASLILYKDERAFFHFNRGATSDNHD